ncbi:MAG: asparaginase domain-containing protein [Patescibacteria group bacterium]
MVKTHVHIIKMGGTIEFIDPAYDNFNKKLLKLDANIDSYLHNLVQPHFNFSTEQVAEKDSRDINEEDRERLVKAIQSSPHQNILITHGTFTMLKTAQFLTKQGFSNKKIILTGSMIPIIGFAASDAGFNLGFAIASFLNIEPGVYLSMNGGIFNSDEVEKNVELFRFE